MIYFTVGFERLPVDKAKAVANLILSGDHVSALSEAHRTNILFCLLPMVQHLQFKAGELEMTTKSVELVLEFANNIMLITPSAWKDRCVTSGWEADVQHLSRT